MRSMQRHSATLVSAQSAFKRASTLMNLNIGQGHGEQGLGEPPETSGRTWHHSYVTPPSPITFASPLPPTPGPSRSPLAHTALTPSVADDVVRRCTDLPLTQGQLALHLLSTPQSSEARRGEHATATTKSGSLSGSPSLIPFVLNPSAHASSSASASDLGSTSVFVSASRALSSRPAATPPTGTWASDSTNAASRAAEWASPATPRSNPAATPLRNARARSGVAAAERVGAGHPPPTLASLFSFVSPVSVGGTDDGVRESPRGVWALGSAWDDPPERPAAGRGHSAALRAGAALDWPSLGVPVYDAQPPSSGREPCSPVGEPSGSPSGSCSGAKGTPDSQRVCIHPGGGASACERAVGEGDARARRAAEMAEMLTTHPAVLAAVNQIVAACG